MNSKEPFVFEIDPLVKQAEGLHHDYINARPFPHVVIDDFLPLENANTLLDFFPDKNSKIWLDSKRNMTYQPNKQGIGHASRLRDVSPYLQNMLFALNSYPFLNFLTILTGINKLLPDPYFYGGGLQQILSGGSLAIHTDITDRYQLDIYRRINVLLYLNKDWQPEYRGELQFWDENLNQCIESILPTFNRIVVFNTDKKSFHGHPIPLNTPPDVTRKSLALYYHTAKPSPDDAYGKHVDWHVVM